MWREHLEYAFGLMAILLGTTLLLSIGTNQISFDEHIHFGATYDLSFFSEIKTTESAMEMRADTIPAFSNEQERKFVAAYENQKNDVHPPLYYLILRFAMGFHKNSYSYIY